MMSLVMCMCKYFVDVVVAGAGWQCHNRKTWQRRDTSFRSTCKGKQLSAPMFVSAIPIIF